MEQVTLRLPLRLKAELEREAAERGVTRSEHVRDVLWSRGEADDLRAQVKQLRDRVEQREERIDDLEEQLRRRSEVEEKVDTLAKRVDQDGDPDAPFFVRWYRWYQNRREE